VTNLARHEGRRFEVEDRFDDVADLARAIERRLGRIGETSCMVRSITGVPSTSIVLVGSGTRREIPGGGGFKVRRRAGGGVGEGLQMTRRALRVPKITRLLVLGHHFERLVREGKVKARITWAIYLRSNRQRFAATE
jgi:hypothetical protein